MKYKLELTPEQMLTLYTALSYYTEDLENILVDENDPTIQTELFVVKSLKNRIAAKLIP